MPNNDDDEDDPSWKEIQLVRKLTSQESKALHAQLYNLLLAASSSQQQQQQQHRPPVEQDVNDLLDYIISVVKNQKSVHYCRQELALMTWETPFCPPNVAHRMAKTIAAFVQKINAMVAALKAVDSTGVSNSMLSWVKKWLEWHENEGPSQVGGSYGWLTARGQFKLDFSSRNGATVDRRDAEYMVECLRVVLPMEIIIPQKQTALCLEGSSISREAFAVICNFLQQPDAHLTTFILGHLPPEQYRRVLESLHNNASVKELHLHSDNSHIDGGLPVSEMLRNKTDLVILRFDFGCEPCFPYYLHTYYPIADILPGLRQRHVHLKTLGFVRSYIGDEHTRMLVETIGDARNVPSLTHLDLSFNRITSIGLDWLARCRARFLKLTLCGNQRLLEHFDPTRRFVETVLLSDEMSLLELHVDDCGEHAAVIIRACENDNCKLQVLDVSTRSRNHLPLILDQVFESVPKMKSLKRLICDKLFTIRPHHPPIMMALYKNTSIVELKFLRSSVTSFHQYAINSILIRNQRLTHAETLVALQPTTHKLISSKSGVWCKAFAKMGAQLYQFEDVWTSTPDSNSYVSSDDTGDDADDDDDDDEAGASSEGTASSSSSAEERRSEDNEGPEEGRLPDIRPPPVEPRLPDEYALPDIRLLDEGPLPGDEELDIDNTNTRLQGEDCMADEFPGKSAIFKILQSRPAIFEKQQRRPAPDVVVARGGGQTGVAQQNQQPFDAPRMRNDDGGGVGDHRLQDANADAGRRKRRRL
jgi:hypothetical protein